MQNNFDKQPQNTEIESQATDTTEKTNNKIELKLKIDRSLISKIKTGAALAIAGAVGAGAMHFGKGPEAKVSSYNPEVNAESIASTKSTETIKSEPKAESLMTTSQESSLSPEQKEAIVELDKIFEESEEFALENLNDYNKSYTFISKADYENDYVKNSMVYATLLHELKDPAKKEIRKAILINNFEKSQNYISKIIKVLEKIDIDLIPDSFYTKHPTFKEGISMSKKNGVNFKDALISINKVTKQEFIEGLDKQ